MKFNMNNDGIEIETSKFVGILSEILISLLLLAGVSALVLLIKLIITKIIGG